MFDVYYKWLGIPPKEQPPNHYRLLGLELFESDVEVIEAAANRQMAYVQQRATGEHAAISQKLLNELSAARVCLLDSRKKAGYDAKLKAGTANSTSTIEPHGIEQMLREEQEKILQQAKQAYDERRYEKVVEILKGELASESDPRFQQLLKSAKVSLGEIQRLSKELDLAWKQKDTKRLTEIANEILKLQPFHLAANKAIRWVARPRFARFRPSVLPTGTNIKDEPFLRKHLALVAAVFLAAFGLCSILVYQQIASSKGDPRAVVSSLPHRSKGSQEDAVKTDRAKVTRQQTHLRAAIYNIAIDPPEATLAVKFNEGFVTGTGNRRQVRIDHIPDDGNVVIVATCSGYKSSEQQYAPTLGKVVDLQIRLEKVPQTETEGERNKGRFLLSRYDHAATFTSLATPVVLKSGHGEDCDRLSTTKAFRPPVEITIVAKTDSTNLRVSYAAEQIIFNWESDRSHLRIDGGPADGKHKAGAGEIPINAYVTIKWVVTPSEQSIYVDNSLRFSHVGDYSGILRPVSVFPHYSEVTVKSLDVKEVPSTYVPNTKSRTDAPATQAASPPASLSPVSRMTQVGVLNGHKLSVTHLSFSPDGRFAASGGGDKTVRLWNVETLQEVWRKSDFLSGITGLQFGSDGEKVFAADRANVWAIRADSGEGRSIFHIPLPNVKNDDGVVAFSHACSLIAVHKEGKGILCDLRKHRVVARMNEWIRCIEFLPDDTGILGALEDMRVLNLQNGQVRPVTSTPQLAYCESIAISPDGTRVVSGTGRCFKAKGVPPDANRVRVWDIGNGGLLHDLQDHRQWVWAVTFTPDGKYILSGGGGCNDDFGGFRADADHAIRFWDGETGKVLQKVDPHRAGVLSLAVSKDGTHALSGSADGTIVLWKLDTRNSGSSPAAESFHSERLLAEWVFSRGGTVFVGPADLETDEKAKRSSHIQNVSGLPSSPFTVKEISFHRCRNIGNNDLYRLEQAKYVQKLWLDHTSVDGGGLKHIEKLTNLRMLFLGGSRVTDGGMVSVSKLTNLRFLGLNATTVTDVGIRRLGSLKQLKRIHAHRTTITDATVRETLPNCEILR